MLISKNAVIYKLEKVFDKDFINILIHAKNYLLATIALKAISIITLPLLTTFLNTEEYGLLALFNSYIGIAVIIMPLYLYSATGRYYYEYKNDYDEFIGTSIILSTISFILTLTIILFVGFDIFFDFSNSDLPLKEALIFITFMKFYSGIYYITLVPSRQSKLTAKLNVTEGYLNISISIILVILLPNYKVVGPLIGVFVSSAYVFIVSILKFRKIVKYNLRFEHIAYILKFSLPQLPYALSSVIIAQFGRIIVGKSNGLGELGIYSIGLQIATIYILISSSLRTAILPDFYKFYDRSDYSKIDELWKKFVSVCIIPASIIVSFSKEIIILLSNSRYHQSYIVVPIFVLGYVFFDLFNIYSTYIEYKKQTWILSAIVVFSGLLNIILSYILVSKIGLIGGAYSFLIVYFLLFLITFFIVNNFKKIFVVNLKRLLNPILSLIALVICFYIINELIESNYINFFIRSSLFLTYMFLHFKSFILKLIKG